MISLKIVPAVSAFKEVLGTPLGGKQMALQAFGHHPWRSLFWFGWLLLPTATPHGLAMGSQELSKLEKKTSVCGVGAGALCRGLEPSLLM